MGVFSFLKKEKKLKCDWCGTEIEKPVYIKHVGSKKFIFCSASCKQSFRKSDKGKGSYRRCPSCAMSPRSWD